MMYSHAKCSFCPHNLYGHTRGERRPCRWCRCPQFNYLKEKPKVHDFLYIVTMDGYQKLLNPLGPGPALTFAFQDEALKRAEELAKLNPGVTFYVAKLTHRVKVEEVRVEVLG